MARQTTVISGTAGSVIMYERNGKQCMRSKPGRIKQTAATKKRSSNFSIASQSAGMALRYLSAIFRYKDGTRYYRLTGAFSHWLKTFNLGDIPAGTIPYLQEFEINPPKMLGSKWKNNIMVIRNSNGLQINIADLMPAEMMAVPKDTSIINLTISSMIRNIENIHLNHTVTTSFSMPNNGTGFSAINMQHELAIIPGSILLSGFSVECKDNWGRDVKLRTGYTLPAQMVYAEWIGV